MKHICLYILTALLVASCSGNRQGITLQGEFKGLSQGEFLCYSESPEWGTLDTIKVNDGKFRFTHDLQDTAIVTLQYPNFMRTHIIAIPGKTAKLRGDANNMRNINVSGDDENRQLTDFRLATAELKEPDMPRAAEEFIRHNPAGWTSIVLLERYFLQAEQPDYAKIRSLLDLMLKACPKRGWLHRLDNQLRPLLNCAAGSPLPDFRTTTLDGTTLSRTTFRGNPLLITLWTTDDNEFIYPLRQRRSLMRRLAGRINQLNICLDTDTTRCRQILRADTIGGYNVCDLQSFNSPLVNLFGLKRLPATILVDAKGIIRARDIAPEQLETTLGKYGIR